MKKTYIAPTANSLAMNLNENIARSEGETRLHFKYDVSTGLVINVPGLAKDEYTVAMLLEWVRQNSQDTAINACY